MSAEELEKFTNKLAKVQRCVDLLKGFRDFIKEARWNERFEMSLPLFLEQIADANMRIFLGMARPADLVPQINAVSRQGKVMPAEGGVADEEVN